ncbi:MAG: glycosyl hydrolase family 8 [Candidatus Saganbacteria bacterium]|nr:glycosyl hydrolase family 8 [Candidatus Saganbacteria bacterium]
MSGPDEIIPGSGSIQGSGYPFGLTQQSSGLQYELEEYGLAELESGLKAGPVFWQLTSQPTNVAKEGPLYTAWKNRFVFNTACGGTFVVDPTCSPEQKQNPQICENGVLKDPLHDGRITSESMAFGLIFAIQNNDHDLFNRLLNSLDTDMMQRGLPVWQGYIDGNDKFVIGPKNRKTDETADYNASASDADIQIGLALVQAYQKAKSGEDVWRVGEERYKKMAERTLDLIWKKDVVDGGEYTILKASNVDPGPGANVGARVNPSYFAFAAFELFAKFDNERSHRWVDLKKDCYEILNIITENGIILNGNGQDVLLWQMEPIGKFTQIPDWVAVWYKDDAYQIRALSEEDAKAGRTYYQGFDAIRAFWQIALDALWYKDEQAILLARRLIDQLERRGIFDPRDIPIFDGNKQAPIYGPRMANLAVYAALAQAAATPIQSLPGTKPSHDQIFGVDKRYIAWENKTSNLFLLTFQAKGDKAGPYFMDQEGPSSYYDQTTGTMVSLILSQKFNPVFEGEPNPLSRTAEELAAPGSTYLRFRGNMFLSILDDSKKAKLNDIVGAYRMLEGKNKKETSSWKNMETRFQLARALAAFGYKKEAVEQYEIILSVADAKLIDPKKDPLYYNIVLNAYLEIKTLIKDTETTASGIRKFKEIAAVNPNNPFATLGQAQFKRDLYSLPGYIRTVRLEAYRLKAEALLQLSLAEYGESESLKASKKEEKQTSGEQEKEALELLALARGISGIKQNTLKEGLLIAEAEFYSNKARIDMERPEGGVLEIEKARGTYQKSLEIYVQLLKLNNHLFNKAPLRKKNPYRHLAQFIILRIIDLHIKMGEAEEKLNKGTGKTWAEKSNGIIQIASTKGEVISPEMESTELGREIRKAVLLVEGGWEMEEDAKKKAMQEAKWKGALQAKKVSAAKLLSFQETVDEFKRFLALAPTGKWRFIFEKQQYALEGMDHYKMEHECATFRAAIKKILDCWGNPEELLQKELLSNDMNEKIRVTLDLIRSGHWEKAKARLMHLVILPTEVEQSRRNPSLFPEDKCYNLTPEAAEEMIAWSDEDLQFVLNLQKVFTQRPNISDIEVFLTDALQKDDLLKSYANGTRSTSKAEKEKLEEVQKLLGDLQLQVARWDTDAAAKVIEDAIRTLEEKYKEYPYDPEWTNDFMDSYYALIDGARMLGAEDAARLLLLTGYSEMIGQSYWKEEYDYLQDGSSDQPATENLELIGLPSAMNQAQGVLRDIGIGNLMFTTFSEKTYLKRDILKTIAGIIWGKNICASFALHQQAKAFDSENLEINGKIEDQTPRLTDACREKLKLK